MTRLLEILVAVAIVFVLAVGLGIALPSHRHIERSVVVSSPARQIFDVIDGFRTFPSWTALRAYDRAVQMNPKGAAMGPGAEFGWTSKDERIGDGSLKVSANPPPQQDKQVTWDLSNNWRGENKHFTIGIEPAANLKTAKVTMGYDVDYGFDLIARYSGLYLQGDPATQMQYQLTAMQAMLATFPNIDYTENEVQVKDIEAKPIVFVSTTAKRTDADAIPNAIDAAMTQLQAEIKKEKLNAAGPRTTITTNWGDENYDFDVALPVDHAATSPTDPVKAGNSYSGKALVTSFTGPSAQLQVTRLMLKAYAYTHGYLFDESSEGNGRFYDELTDTDATKAAAGQETFTVYLPVQL
jgi:hypothetical protein